MPNRRAIETLDVLFFLSTSKARSNALQKAVIVCPDGLPYWREHWKAYISSLAQKGLGSWYLSLRKFIEKVKAAITMA